MKSLDIFGTGLSIHARSPFTWLLFAVLFSAAFLLRWTSGNPAATPFDIAQETILTCLLWVFIAPVIAGEAAAREVPGSAQSPASAPIGKAADLGGRFLAAFVTNALILLSVPLGCLAASTFGTASHSVSPAVHFSSYWPLALPTAFTFTAVQFSAAAWKRSAIASYAGSVIFYATVSLLAALTVNVLGMPTLGQILDPTCRVSVLIVIPEALTPIEKSAALDGLGSSILANRLLWISAAAALLVFTHRRFRLGPLGA